jgi:predicted small metal-binding protein
VNWSEDPIGEVMSVVPNIKEIGMKLVRCRDHGFDCDFRAESDSEEEILKAVAAHAQHVHGLEVTPELVKQVRATIQEVPAG